MEKEIVSAIQKFIKIKRDEENILNIIVRDDVFAILEKECCVLYYSLDDDIDGCHICKPLNGEMKQCCVTKTSISLKQLTPVIHQVFRERQDKLKELQAMYAEKDRAVI